MKLNEKQARKKKLEGEWLKLKRMVRLIAKSDVKIRK